MRKALHTVQSEQGQQLSFLPVPEFSPALPARHTLEWQALVLMLEGESIEQPEWLKITGSWRLAATMKALDYLGWPVQSLPVHRKGFKRPIARYSLPWSAIQFGRELVAKEAV
ncbi:hypothetical protein KAK07_12290 [Ideonella sp. 4Y16]|uniref:hypothetical protein n=1 Tax=Ideonella alba TaxID=2824118 RepID=UPI001B392710|nr:hypothetical protein [Ideonella alba]MBQ0944114.1 hypothetical protein [Ideonella alba]